MLFAKTFEIDKGSLKIKNFQIVNGGQTTKTLTRIVNDLPDEVQILMRLTKIKDKTQTSKISWILLLQATAKMLLVQETYIQVTEFKAKYSQILIQLAFYDKKMVNGQHSPKRNIEIHLGIVQCT